MAALRLSTTKCSLIAPWFRGLTFIFSKIFVNGRVRFSYKRVTFFFFFFLSLMICLIVISIYHALFSTSASSSLRRIRGKTRPQKRNLKKKKVIANLSSSVDWWTPFFCLDVQGNQSAHGGGALFDWEEIAYGPRSNNVPLATICDLHAPHAAR